MINIILKNKNLIKIYKYSVKIFKFLNKHLYILSILSLIARARKSIYYKAISFLLKIILAINLLITSGLFFSVVDLHTPLNTIYSFYNDLLGPYIEILKSKYDEITNIYTNAEKKYVSGSTIKSSTPLETELPEIPTLNEKVSDDKIEIKFNYNKIIFYSAVALLLYFTFVIPGGSTPPANYNDYNYLNQGFIDVKNIICKNWNIFKFIFTEGAEEIVPDSPEIIQKSITNSPDRTPIASSSKLPPLQASGNYNLFNNKVNKSIQTDLSIKHLNKMSDIIIDLHIRNISNQIDTNSNLLNSTQLLEDDDENIN